jgi:DNA primase
MEEVSIYEAASLAAAWFNVAFDGPVREERNEKTGSHSPSAAVAEQSSPKPEQRKPESERESNEPNKPLAFQLNHLDPQHPYFVERGLTPETVERFGLGFCRKGLLNGRAAIPIHNGNGELVAYAGRWPGQPPNERPKYQLPKGFRKSLEVFNLHRVRETDPTSPLIIVEGFFDCMKVWQAGITRVVALMGSSLSPVQEEQIAALVGTKGQLALMLDDDEAGLTAREQALGRFASRAYVRVIELRNFGCQPDELSVEQLQELLLHDEPAEYETLPAKFSLGCLVATPNALQSLSELDIRTALARHVRGDWGVLDELDRIENELSLEKGFRLFSQYYGENGTKFWIITEADRSATTVLLPEDY